MASFFQTKFTFFDKLILKGGVRYEKVDIGVNDYTTIPRLKLKSNFVPADLKNAPITPSISVKGGDLKYDALVSNVGLRYNLSTYFQPFVSFSQGFSVADIGRALRDAKVDELSKINTEAVVVSSYEAGFTTHINRLKIEVAGYAVLV